MTAEIDFRSARAVRDAVVTGVVSAREVTEQTIERIRVADADLHSFITVCEAYALQQADELDRRQRAGEEPGPLWGVPFSVKDLYDTAGVTTTFGSRAFAANVPERDAVLVERIRSAGGVLVGKTNTSEFAIYIRTVNDLQPETVNPWDQTRTTGGSSGGAAASVAAGLTPLAVGSDGGGSVRIPAALCGVVGLMPSRGSIPRTGGHIGTRRFSAAGPISNHAADALSLWRVMQGPHHSDALSQRFFRSVELPRQAAGQLRIRWIGDSGVPGAERDVVDAAAESARRLADCVEAELDRSVTRFDSPQFADAFYDMMQADRVSTGGAALMADASISALLTDYGRHQFERGARVTGAAYSRAVEVQLAATQYLRSLLAEADVIATPTLAFIAPQIPHGAEALPEDARRGFVSFTFLMNYAGFPAITVPAGLVRGMPIGLQLIGRPGAEEFLLELCQAYQDAGYRMPAPPAYANDDPQLLQRQ